MEPRIKAITSNSQCLAFCEIVSRTAYEGTPLHNNPMLLPWIDKAASLLLEIQEAMKSLQRTHSNRS